MVTVTVSMDCLPLALVITSWAHRMLDGAPICWIVQVEAEAGMAGTAPVIVPSLQLTPVSGRDTPSLPTRATVPAVVPKPKWRVTNFWLNGATVAIGPE